MRTCLILFWLLAAPLKATFWRAQPIPRPLQNVQVCCPAPMPNWGAFNSECDKSGPQNSCRLACIFNASSALQGDNQLDLAQVRSMLERAFDNQQDLIDVYALNFANCSSMVFSKYAELTRMSRQSDACDRHALFYSLCAYSRLINRCPANMWQKGNQKCQEARSFMKNYSWTALKMYMEST